MTESSLPAAGWYPAAHAGGELRYWDGATWLEATAAADAATAAVPTQGEPDAAGRRPSFWSKPMKRKTGLIVTGSALVLGLLMGSGAGGAGAQSEVSALKVEVAALETNVADAETVAADNDAALADAQADLASALAELKTATASLETTTAQITEMETTAAASQTELDARAARIAELEGQLSTQVAVAPAPAAPAPVEAVQAPSAPSSVYYKNCTAARDAGAAPVYAGQPGYGRHLDRDGDGVGCE